MKECIICYNNSTELVLTECLHSYCINCLSHIKICAMCRNPLNRAKLCCEIKNKITIIDNIKIYEQHNISIDNDLNINDLLSPDYWLGLFNFRN